MDLETELEEGEACFQNHNDDEDSTIDPDIALSYIDEKLQDVLGHFQKDFEGGVSAENLGAKFGGYGSFLPTYQRSPVCPHPKVVTHNAPVSPVNEGGPPNSIPQSSARHVGAPRGKTKQEVPTSSGTRANKSALNRQPRDHNSLKVRIKVGPDNSSTQRNAEIYSGLGLDVSPSSSLEASPGNSDGFFHVTQQGPDESPTSILEIMTSFPVCGGTLLSPLADNLLCLTEKETWADGLMYKGSQESTITGVNASGLGKVDRNQKKSKSSEKNSVSMESTNGNDVFNDLKIPLPSNARCNSTDFEKGASFSHERKEESFDIAKEEPVGPVLTRDDHRVEKNNRKDGAVGKVSDAKNADFDEKMSFPTKADSDVSKGSKILDKSAQKATSREKDPKLAPGKDMSSSGGRKKPKESQVLETDSRDVDFSRGGLKHDSSSTSRNWTNASGSKGYVEDVKKNTGKVNETYKDFFGELDLEHEEDDDDMALEEKNDTLVTVESNIWSKESNGKKSQKPYARVGSHVVSTTGGGPVSDVAVAAVAPVVNEDWVCCDKCEKWRLLPPGVNPGSLPEKWLCSMLDWLPGMNRCSISEEETTKAITSRFPGPAPCEPHLGGIPFDQNHQPFGLKKKLISRDVANETKQERPSLSSNSAKKNLQTPYKSRSFQSPHVNEVEFQDSGQSSSLIAEKHKLKHNEKKKLGENFLDEGDNSHHSKIRYKRDTVQDYPRDSKKVKTDDKHGTDEDRGSDHGGAVFKASRSSSSGLPSKKDRRKHNNHPKDPKSASKDGTLPMGKSGKTDVAKKRKSNECEYAPKYVEETSETEQRKEKKARVLEGRGRNAKEEQLRSSDLIDSSRRDVASLAATSSSSKVSGSHKTKPNNQEPKGSPVESVSSSPLRVLNPNKFTSSRKNLGGIDGFQDAGSPKKCSDGDDDRVKNDYTQIASHNRGFLEKDKAKAKVGFETCQVGGGVNTLGQETSSQIHNDERANGFRPRKKGSSLRSKDKNRSFKSDADKPNLNVSEPMNENVGTQVKSKGAKNKSLEKPVSSDKFGKGSASMKDFSGKPSSGSAKRDVDFDGERCSKRDVERGLPPSGRGQNETERLPRPIPASQKEKAAEGDDDANKNRIAENQNASQPMNTRHPTPNRHKGRDHDAPSPLRSQGATNVLKEAKDLKHLADRLKNSGSHLESRAIYFQAALKFLQGASLLEACNSESGKHGDMIQAMSMYSSTAKLCEYCAHEYEKSKEMATAALAYKCTEVAYLKVVYSSHASACRDRHELQTSLQIGPTGESPSSSASDLDNLNNPATVDKTPLAKGVNSPQVAGNHVIAARNKPNFVRILNYAQDVNFAMEASRKSRVAFAASQQRVSAVKTALDFNFQDVEGLLRLVRVAMEVINK